MNTIKEKLEKEREVLVGQLSDIATHNQETDEWEAVPEQPASRETDQNDMADKFEDFEERSDLMDVLEARYKNIQKSLADLEAGSFGKCEECKSQIEADRIEANPAARKCKEHMNS